MSELLRWQWQGYPRYHRSRANLLLHIVLVPVFVLGNVVLLVALTQRSWSAVLVALVVMVVSIALQGRGHRPQYGRGNRAWCHRVCRVGGHLPLSVWW